ncbi:glutamyl-tRNA reductase [Pseudarthrobacter sp. O4]|uniref:glutamyl-tRNA reductase n=1 Tax=Pseudarthrobacter sp. O4 TaxID=3418417 RepID=UPI003CF4937E
MSGTHPTADPASGDSGSGPVLLALIARYRDLDHDSAARLHAVSTELAPDLLASSPAVSGSLVLSTCNRFEIYCEVPSARDVESARSDALAALCRCSGLPAALLTSHFEYVQGASVPAHLFAVAAGLDSVVVGERQVSGQVRRALADAQLAGTAGGRLSRLFQAASRVSKAVGARTALSAAGRSIATVALDLAAIGSSQGSLAGASVVLVGTGAYAAHVAELLRSRQCISVAVYSHSGRAAAFAAARGGTPLTERELPAAAAAADVIIGSSGTGARIGAASLARWRQDAARPLTVIDLAPSHDFDPHVADLPGVELITLGSVQLAAPPADAEALRLAHALVRQAARQFEEQEAIRAVDAAVVALRRYIQDVLDAEMERVRRQHGGGAPAEDVNIALRRIVRRLLHTPTVRARELATAGRQADYTAALEALFGLDVQLSSAASAAP